MSVKRIRITVEWDGAAGESSWAGQLSRAIEEADLSGVSRVVDVENLTAFGETEVRELSRAERLRAVQLSVRKGCTFREVVTRYRLAFRKPGSRGRRFQKRDASAVEVWGEWLARTGRRNSSATKGEVGRWS